MTYIKYIYALYKRCDSVFWYYFFAMVDTYTEKLGAPAAKHMGIIVDTPGPW